MYDIYIGELKLPLLPENLREDIKIDNKKYDILSLGQVVSKGKTKLKSWTIKSIFNHEEIDVEKARDYLISLVNTDKLSTKPIRFIVNRYKDDKTLTFDTNCLVLIDSISFEDKAGEVGDLNYEIKLIEYREFGGKLLK